MILKTNYIIITPAKNEEKFIEKTIQSVITQTIPPMRWVIVDDGSTDRTADIVKKYLKDYPFIQLVQRELSNERHFGNKVYAIRRGFEEVKDLDYEFYCNLDADVSFEPDYFEKLIIEFRKNNKLGICGGRAYYQIRKRWKKQLYANDSVPGFTQFFRKECYKQSGGYNIYKYGNEDGYVENKAKSLGWIVETFEDIKIFHHRISGTNWGNIVKRRFISGKIEYYYNFFYPYHLLKSFILFFKHPIFIGTITQLFGYFHSFINKEPRIEDKDFVSFIRIKQKKKLKSFLKLFNEKT